MLAPLEEFLAGTAGPLDDPREGTAKGKDVHAHGGSVFVPTGGDKLVLDCGGDDDKIADVFTSNNVGFVLPLVRARRRFELGFKIQVRQD